MTESAAIATEAEKACYKELDVDEYKIIATLDKRTSQICREMDGKHFPVSEMKAGVTAPPFHPWCRTDTAPYFDDWEETGISPERAARDQADQVYYVPENMTYREWESKYIQNYKPVTRGKDVDFQYSAEKTINTNAVEGYDDVYVSDKAEIKPKALHDINQKTEKYMKMWGVPLSEKPKIVIVDQEEISGAYGRYDAISNTVYYSPVIANFQKLEEIGKSSGELARIGDTESHEMWHAKQAYDYRRSGHTITEENQGEYFESLCKKCKKNIDKLGITEYNVKEISVYASRRYAIGRYDEVEAEYMMLHRKE